MPDHSPTCAYLVRHERCDCKESDLHREMAAHVLAGKPLAFGLTIKGDLVGTPDTLIVQCLIEEPKRPMCKCGHTAASHTPGWCIGCHESYDPFPEST